MIQRVVVGLLILGILLFLFNISNVGAVLFIFSAICLEIKRETDNVRRY